MCHSEARSGDAPPFCAHLGKGVGGGTPRPWALSSGFYTPLQMTTEVGDG